jgi:hypothetical protein
MDNDVALARAARAKEILDSEIYQEAYETVKREIQETWAQSPSRDVEGREKLFLMLKMLDKVQITMQSVLETGKLAKGNLEYKETLAERAKAYLGVS